MLLGLTSSVKDCVAGSYFVSWLVFAGVWYLIALIHGDLDPLQPEDHKVCVENVEDFTSAFLFSVETQHTIGYVRVRVLVFLTLIGSMNIFNDLVNNSDMEAE